MTDYDAIIIGAGFGGIYQLQTLRQLGLKCLVVDQAGDVGGTWYHNLYPGAMSDTESFVYRYSWDKDDLQTYPWPEHYVKQPEVLAYLRHVVEKHDLRRDMLFETELRAARWDEETSCWELTFSPANAEANPTTETKTTLKSTYLITSLGLLSARNFPSLPGLNTFTGATHHTASWPANLDLANKRVGILGSGSTGVQVITDIAGKVGHLTCFQRHPQYSVPSGDRKVTSEYREWVNGRYEEVWEGVRDSVTAFGFEESRVPFGEVGEEDAEKMFGTFSDITTNPTANEAACAFIRRKIASIVHDPGKAAALTPHDVYARRPLCDGQAASGEPHSKTGYYAQFNRPNVDIVPLLTNPIEKIEPAGVRTSDGALHELDILIFATGFDAVEGNYTRLAITGSNGRSLADAWKDSGPSSFLGVAVAGFPNFFMVNGPKGAFTNQPPMIEVQVEFIRDVIGEARGRAVRVREEAEEGWKRECEGEARGSLFWEAEDNWIFGANIPGKKRCLRFYFGGMKKYREHLIKCEDNGFEGFEFEDAVAFPHANGEVKS